MHIISGIIILSQYNLLWLHTTPLVIHTLFFSLFQSTHIRTYVHMQHTSSLLFAFCRSSVRSWVWMLQCLLTLVQECTSCATRPRKRPSGWGSHQTYAVPCVVFSSSSIWSSTANWTHFKWSSSSFPQMLLTGTSRCGLQTQRIYCWRGPKRL